MRFATFADRAAAIEAEDGDLATAALVADLFADADEDLPVVVRFLQGRVFPAHSGETLDVGTALCHESLARAAGPDVDVDDVESRLAEAGEIGAVAADLDLGGQRGLAAFGEGGEDDLTVAGVDEQLRELARAAGDGSEDRKRQLLFDLFNRASPLEAKYLARLVLGEMRVGVGGGTVRDAVALVFLADAPGGVDGEDDDETGAGDDDIEEATSTTLTAFEADDGDGRDESEPDVVADASGDDVSSGPRTPSDAAVEIVERALQVTNDYGRVATLARDGGRDALAEVSLEVGRPVQAMLAQAGSVVDALASWDAAAVEVKFDGARVQVHHDPDGETRVFSRNMDDVTGALPEVVDAVADLPDRVILDGEVVAIDDDGAPLPFQEVLRRFRRKHDVDRVREEVAVEFHAFDCLHHVGDDLLDSPLVERHERLESVLPSAAADLVVTDDPDEIEAVDDDALAAGHEGVMLKDPESTYSPGKRGRNWLKRKPDVETLDLVVTGAEWGEGRRANLLGTFLLSVLRADADGDDAYETVGKVATGITDERLAELTELLEPEIVAEDGTDVDLRPSVVFEVGYEELQSSPTYSSGYALRFPRFVGVRSDKGPDDADTLERLERLADGQ